MTQAENTDFDFRAALRSPWLYARLLLAAAAALFGYFAPPPSNPDAVIRYGIPLLFVTILSCLFASTGIALLALRSKPNPERVWVKPSWTTNPFRSEGPHHMLHVVGVMLIAAGLGELICELRYPSTGFNPAATGRFIMGATSLSIGQCLVMGMWAAQGIFAKSYGTAAYVVATRQLPDRTNRIASFLWAGVLLTITLIFAAAFVVVWR